MPCWPRDILSEWNYPTSSFKNEKELCTLTKQEKLLFESLGVLGGTPDEVALKTGWSVSETAALLTQLELAGKIKSLPGNKFVSV
jgi:predicted Rossmann fold nucleotide-binding protein DprA/Smf involved in DNA uptake